MKPHPGLAMASVTAANVLLGCCRFEERSRHTFRGKGGGVHKVVVVVVGAGPGCLHRSYYWGLFSRQGENSWLENRRTSVV